MNLNRLALIALFALSACYPPFPDVPYQPRTSSGAGVGGGGGGGFGGGSAACGAPLEQDAVVRPTNEPPPLIGGTMVALRGGGFAIGDVDRGLVWLISADLLTARQVPLVGGEEPGRAIEGADGRVYVALRRTDQLAEVNVAMGTLRRLATCHLPRGLAFRDDQVVVGCLGGELESIDPVTGTRTPIAVSSALSDLRDVVVDGDRLLVTQLRAGAVSSVGRDGRVKALTTARLSGLEPHVAWRAVASPAGGAMLVRQQHRTTQFATAVTTCSTYGGVTTSSGTGGSSGSGVVQTEAVSVFGDTASVVPLSQGSFAPIVLPVDVAVSPSGRVAVLSAGTGSLTLLELGARTDVPLVIHGVDTQVTSVVFSGESAYVFVREPGRVMEVSRAGLVLRTLELSTPSVASTGHELFHRATAAGLACASCHPEGGEDGHVWPFLEGARRTPTLRGGIGGTAPFHWSGELASMGALMHDVMAVRMNGPQLTDSRVLAVERWLNLQAAMPPPAVDGAAAARGQILFESSATACSSCHSGPKGTNNATMNVGTGDAFQVPRLAEFAWRGPWFHDGRMGSLQARFNASSGGESHGHVSQLTPQERLDLMEYLKTR